MFTNHKISFSGFNNLNNLKIDNNRGINTEVKVLMINLDKANKRATLLKVEDITSMMMNVLLGGLPAQKIVTTYENSLRFSSEPIAHKLYLEGMIDTCGVFFNLPIKTKTLYLPFITNFDAGTLVEFMKKRDWFGEYYGQLIPEKRPKGADEYMKMAIKFVPDYLYK